MPSEEYVELVLSAVEQIPAGRVMAYGDIAEYVGQGGPRQVGWVMSHHGGGVPWWRVVRADGAPHAAKAGEAIRRLRSEGVPFVHETSGRVDIRRARWSGEPEGSSSEPRQRRL